jgi:hypothetical protein
MEDLRQDLSALTKQCRPGRDITTPELRKAWQVGRKELFYPYGKTYAKPSASRIRARYQGRAPVAPLAAWNYECFAVHYVNLQL